MYLQVLTALKEDRRQRLVGDFHLTRPGLGFHRTLGQMRPFTHHRLR